MTTVALSIEAKAIHSCIPICIHRNDEVEVFIPYYQNTFLTRLSWADFGQTNSYLLLEENVTGR